MKEFKGTPGEWLALDHGVGDIVVYEQEGQSAICVFDSDDRSIAWPPEDYLVSGEAMANAHLIAASKNLLSALQQSTQSMLDSGYSPDSAVIRANQAAIAKALGEDHE